MPRHAIEALNKMLNRLATVLTTSEIKLFQGVRMTAWARPTICSHGMRACVGQWEVTLCMNPSWRRSTATGSTMSSGVLTTRAIQSLCWSPSSADGNSCTIPRIEPGASAHYKVLTAKCDNANLTPPVQKRSQLLLRRPMARVRPLDGGFLRRELPLTAWVEARGRWLQMTRRRGSNEQRQGCEVRLR